MGDASLDKEVEQLRLRVAALEQLLEVYERETIEKSDKLEQALRDLQEYAQQLAYSEEALRVLKSILDSMGEGVVVVDERGKLLFINPAAEQILGLSSTSEFLKRWTASWTEPDGLFLADGITPYPAQELPLVRAMRGEAVDTAEMYVRSTQSQAGIWLRVTARPIRSDQGKPQGGVAVFHNITTIRQTEEALRRSEAQSREQATQLEQTVRELQQAQAKLVQTEKMSSLGQLVAGVAHEINNPVSFIHGNIAPADRYIHDLLRLVSLYQQYYPQPVPVIQREIQAIDLDFLKEDLPKLLGSLKIGADRIRQIVRSLRTFSRHDEAEKKPVDIHEGIDSTLLILQNRLRPRPGFSGIQIIKDYSDLPKVECYAGQLNQVFMNILVNAIDALESYEQERSIETIPANSNTILIKTRLECREDAFTLSQGRSAVPIVIIDIRDNGPGMTVDTKAKLFDPFFTTKPVGQGTGLGLYISYQIIVDKHSGTLNCFSTLHQGTEFRIEIPVYQNASPETVEYDERPEIA